METTDAKERATLVALRLGSDPLQRLDNARGAVSRAQWCRNQVLQALEPVEAQQITLCKGSCLAIGDDEWVVLESFDDGTLDIINTGQNPLDQTSYRSGIRLSQLIQENSP
tara:strand:+ start:653 stop:985 length:333 start_codon:yes stop_codon:yes gene_type:complete